MDMAYLETEVEDLDELIGQFCLNPRHTVAQGKLRRRARPAEGRPRAGQRSEARKGPLLADTQKGRYGRLCYNKTKAGSRGSAAAATAPSLLLHRSSSF